MNLILLRKRPAAAAPVVNLITNGTFDADTDWTKGAGWTISAGKAHCAGTTDGLTQAPTTPLVEGHTYRVTFTLVLTSGDISWNFTTSGTPRTASGTYIETFVAAAGDEGASLFFSCYNEAEFTGTIDDVILEDIT